MAESRVEPITAEQALLAWPKIEKLLAPLLEVEGHYLPIDVLVLHIRGEMQIWLSVTDDVEAVMVTQIVAYPRKKTCHIPWVAGENMDAWIDKFVHLVEATARVSGCSRMTCAGREGWVRVAGYKKVGAVLFKDL